MPLQLIHCVEAESVLEAVLLGEPEGLRAAPVPPDEERVNLLQIDVLMLNNRDVWFEFEMRRRLTEPNKVTFRLRFTAEKGLPPACAVILAIAESRFMAPIDADGQASLTVDAKDVLDGKSKRLRKPFSIGLDCPDGA